MCVCVCVCAKRFLFLLQGHILLKNVRTQIKGQCCIKITTSGYFKMNTPIHDTQFLSFLEGSKIVRYEY